MTTERNQAMPRPESKADKTLPFDLYPRITGDPLRQAYAKKVAIHVGMAAESVAGDALQATFGQLLDTTRTEKSTTAYIHIPFCQSRCVYCGFYRIGFQEDFSRPFTDALISELQQAADRAAVRSAPVNALYFGGGTPTSLAAKDLRRLIEAAGACLPLANDCEITVEGRIYNFDEEKMTACLEGGANRFSLGVQTFDTDLRRDLGRLSPGDEVVEALRTLRDMNDAAVIIDLIYGLPGQTLADWEREVNTFLELELDGVDLYQLNIHPRSLLEKKLKENSVAPVADISQQAEMFARGVEIMAGSGARRLSMAHWGTSLRERNMYNILAKSSFPCLAYGPGAGGVLKGHSYFLEPDYKTYMAAREQSLKPVARITLPPPHSRILQVVIPQMEQGYLHLGKVGRSLGIDAGAVFEPLLERYIDAGMMTLENELATLTLAGQFWHVNLTQGLVEWYLRKAKG